MTRFNHLNVPQHWETYWTKYPQGYTILEALIQWVQQVDNMVDNQNGLIQNVEGIRIELNEFVKQFDGNLESRVIDTLREWQESGFLDVVISGALQTQIDEVDTRLTTQLSQTAQEVDDIFRVIDETALATDIQGIDTVKLKERNEYLPVGLVERSIEEKIILPKAEIRSNSQTKIQIRHYDVRKYKDFEFFVSNLLDVEVRIGFEVGGSLHNMAYIDTEGDLVFRQYGTADSHFFHLIPPGVRNVRLSDIPAMRADGNKATNSTPFKGLYIRENLELLYKPVAAPTSGDLEIRMVGVPN